MAKGHGWTHALWGATTAILLSAALMALAASYQAAPAGANVADELINELMCPTSGTPQMLATANTPEAVWMRSFIRAKVAEGWTKQRIVDTLVRQYGEMILPVPPKEGFNLAAWITPFATIVGGAGVLGLLLSRWLRERRRHDAYLSVEMALAVDDEDLRRYEAQLAEELERFE